MNEGIALLLVDGRAWRDDATTDVLLRLGVGVKAKFAPFGV